MCVCVCLLLPLSLLTFVSVTPHPPFRYIFPAQPLSALPHVQPFVGWFLLRVDFTVHREHIGVIQTFLKGRATLEAEMMLLVELNLNGWK